VALNELGPSFYHDLAEAYRARRDLLYSALIEAGFSCTPPEGAYYILCDFSGLAVPGARSLSDTEFAVWLSREIGVTPVPGSSFFREGGGGRTLARFVFCKTDDILLEAARRLGTLSSGSSASKGTNRGLEPSTRSGLQR
jgi:aminotransferase